MVKEIAQGYGLDFNVLNSGTKYLLNNIYNNLNLDKKAHKKDNNNKNNFEDNNDKPKFYNLKEISKSLDTIENQIKDKLQKGNNKKTILTLAQLLNIIYTENWKIKEDTKNQYLFNKDLTNDISEYCKEYFERELKESKGLIFMVNYFNKCESLLQDIESYINKKEWENFEMEIKK